MRGQAQRLGKELDGLMEKGEQNAVTLGGFPRLMLQVVMLI